MNVCFDLFDNSVFQVRKNRRVYLGDFDAYMDMEIYWKDDHCLVVNDVEYVIQW